MFPASSLGKEADINQGLTLGTVDIILTGASASPGNTYPPLAVTYFPFIFRDAEHLLKYAQERRVQGADQGLRRQDRQPHHRAHLLRRAPRHSSATSRSPSRDDMKGLKIRVPDAPAYTRASRRRCGANPTPIAFAEVYLALQNGTVDAQENPLPTIEAKKFFEVQKNISLTGHIVDSLLTVMSRPALWAS